MVLLQFCTSSSVEDVKRDCLTVFLLINGLVVELNCTGWTTTAWKGWTLEGLKLDFFVVVDVLFIIDCTKKCVLLKCMTLAAGFKQYEEYMEYLLTKLSLWRNLFYFITIKQSKSCFNV